MAANPNQAGTAPLTDSVILERFSNLRRYTRGGFVAPNKPITLLWALERLERGAPRLSPYAEAEPELQELLRATGAGRTPASLAFWRLQNDNVWEIASSGPLPARSGDKEPRVTALRAFASGGLSAPVHARLGESAPLREDARKVLSAMIESSPTPEGIRSPLARATVWRIVRGAAFRRMVKDAYGRRCVVCGWGPTQNDQPVGLEAAHVRPLSEDGPEDLSNGVALCANHHALFDAGFFTWNETRRLIVSPMWEESESGDMASLRGREGDPLPEPLGNATRVDDRNLDWHRMRIFRARLA
jgi:putative restriction endonuclease